MSLPLVSSSLDNHTCKQREEPGCEHAAIGVEFTPRHIMHGDPAAAHKRRERRERTTLLLLQRVVTPSLPNQLPSWAPVIVCVLTLKLLVSPTPQADAGCK